MQHHKICTVNLMAQNAIGVKFEIRATVHQSMHKKGSEKRKIYFLVL